MQEVVISAGRRVGPTLAEINVIPLVDVMLVLLIIFMVAAPMLQRGVEVSLPVASRAQDIASERVFVDVPLTFGKDRRVFLGKESIPLDVLPERVRQLMLNRSDKQVFLRIDGRLNVQHQMDVFDELKAGGVRDVGIVTDAPTSRGPMTETVTDIIVARSRQPEGLQTMVLWSAAGHVVLVALSAARPEPESSRRPASSR